MGTDGQAGRAGKVTLLLRALRPGDDVRTPSGELATVLKPADGNGRVLLQYLARPAWQPPGLRGVLTEQGANEVRIMEHLLRWVKKGRRES